MHPCTSPHLRGCCVAGCQAFFQGFVAEGAGGAQRAQRARHHHPVAPALRSFPLPPGDLTQQPGEILQDAAQRHHQQAGHPPALTKNQLQLDKLRAKNRRSQARYREKCKVSAVATCCPHPNCPAPSNGIFESIGCCADLEVPFISVTCHHENECRDCTFLENEQKHLLQVPALLTFAQPSATWSRCNTATSISP